MDAWRKATQNFEKTLTSEEKEVYANSTLEVILSDITSVAETQRTSSRVRRVSTRIKPLLDAIDDYGKALDVLANSLSILPPLWGSLRVIILAAQKYNDYYSKLADMLERVADVLPRFTTYSRLLRFHGPLLKALQAVYTQMISFFAQARAVFKKSSVRMLLIAAWGSFERDFDDHLTRMRRYRELAEDEAKLASIILQIQENERAEEERKHAVNSRRRVERLESMADERSKDQAKNWLNARKCHEEKALMEEGRLEGSCEWILQREEVTKWMQDQDTQIFWLHGAPGCGKSFVYSKLLNSLEEVKPATYFLFCGGDKERVTFSALLRSWCVQLLEHFPQVLADIERVRNINNNRVATNKEIEELLCQVLEHIPTCYLTVDALDECLDNGQFFKKIAFIPTRFKILVTSRTPANIRKDLAKIRAPLQALEIQPELLQSDIISYIDKSLNEADFDYNEETINAIRDRLIDCDGMFLWVRLMIEHLQSQVCEYEMLRCLRELPDGLPQTYDRILERINRLPASQRLLAHKVFLWATTVRRPASVAEVRLLLAVQPTSDVLDEKRLIPNADSAILSVCGGLISLRGPEKKLYFTHFTVTEYVREYVLRQEVLQGITACYDARELTSNDSLAAAVCLRYLSYAFVGGLSAPQSHGEASSLLSQQDPKMSLLSYATTNWFIHLGALEVAETLVSELALAFLDNKFPHLNAWWHLYWFFGPESLESLMCPSNFSGLHVAAYFGLSNLMKELLPVNTLSILDSAQRSPLWWSASRGHVKVTRALLDAGFDPDVRDRYSVAAVHRAAATGHSEVLKEILSSTQPNDDSVTDTSGWTPLHWAASRGHIPIVKQLTQYGNRCGKYGTAKHKCEAGRTPFHLAALNGHHLSLSGLNSLTYSGVLYTVVDAQDKQGSTALHLAALQGHQNVVEELVQLGADLTILDKAGKTAQQKACAMGNEDISSSLIWAPQFDDRQYCRQHVIVKKTAANLERYAIRSIDRSVSSPSSNRSHEKMHSLDMQDISALRSIINGHEGSLEMLTLKGRAWDRTDDRGRTPLHYAATLGYKSILLKVIRSSKLRTGQDGCQKYLNRQDDRGWTALHYAAAGQFHSICTVLLNSGAFVSLKNHQGLTAYDLTVKDGHQLTMESIARYARLPSEQLAADFGWGKEHIDARNGTFTEQDIETMSLEDFHNTDRFGRTPIYRAMEMGQRQIIRILVAKVDLSLKEALELALLAEEDQENDSLLHLFIGKIKPGSLLLDVRHQRLAQHLFIKAIRRNDLQAVTSLFQAGVDINDCADLSSADTPNRYRSALLVAIQQECQRATLFLIDHGADVHASDECGASMLALAASKLLVPVVESLLDQGANPNQGAELRNVPLNRVLSFHNYSKFPEKALLISRLLLDKGASFMSEKDGETPLRTAFRTIHDCYKQNPPISYSSLLVLLKEHVCASLTRLPDDKGFFPIHTAVANHNVGELRDELEAGVPPDLLTVGFPALTALEVAVQNDDIEAARTLIRYGADAGRISAWGPYLPGSMIQNGATDQRGEIVKLLLRELRIVK